MLLSLPRSALGCLLAGGAFLTASLARADAKQCVLHNNDGAQLRDERHLLAARDAYRACIAERECPAMVRSECDAALADIKAALPTLLVAVVDGEGHDLPSATLQVDGRPVVIDGSDLEVDPGAHELSATSGALSAHLRVMAIESELGRRVALVLQAPAPKPLPVLPPAPEPAPRAYWPVYTLGGVAAVAAASWGYFGLSGRAGMDRLDDCKPYCARGDVESVRNKYYAADISLGVSVVALVGAGYFLFAPPAKSPSERASAFSLGVTPQPGGAGLSVRWVE